MAKAHKPRCGSMQYWPRKRAKRQYPRVKSWDSIEEGAKASGYKSPLLGFAGYKVGMTHIIVKDPRAKVLTSGMELSVPVTVVECPPIKIFSVRFYDEENNCLKVAKEIQNSSFDKELSRRVTLAKKKSDAMKELSEVKLDKYKDVRVVVYTQPIKVGGLNKKKPEIFELGIQGSNEDKLKYIKSNLDKEISLSDVVTVGQQLDIHAVTTGRGFQGPMKRFGIAKRRHKSEKSIRNPGSLGSWKAHGHVMYRVSHAGQTGYHTRLEHNKQVYMIENDVTKIIPKGGFINYGHVKSTYMLIKGSILGPKKRMIRFTAPVRPNSKMAPTMPIVEISLQSKQGN